MPNIASLLKDEIARVSRKELRGENQALKKASSQYRTDIAALKRRVTSLERLIARLAKNAGVKAPKTEEDGESSGVQRFSAKGLAAQRRRLGLSAADVALLIGVSALSVYKWESGKTRPRESQMTGIGKLRALSKSQAAEALEALKTQKA
jgi:DNA-binding transcriptional regulator YiaG